ncbi:hypothetical protein HYH02_001325 [Chlamydomonas schloesseri]|uniref:Uncharacterized protein n=1 Tax=Chlamydomonas schloesseri TaxID=2026947 RepID=A0A836BCC3_9CHLO|nr:hypothetical protein HYH02_001325 [Chlamydomonas schloesseri]|eukprot:KAG2454296.1 hypothetical protein HYH02_001325 [Chlamydomonas schloesseri]
MRPRRSESCPRPARKPVSGAGPQAEQAVQKAAPLVTRACTLQDLGPEDKQKVTKLLKQVVELGQEVQTLRQQRDEQAQQFAQREEELKATHCQLHKEHLLLKKKLGQVLLVLRASQAKVHALEAAQQGAELSRKAQPSSAVAAEPDAAVLPRDQQAVPYQQAQAGLGHDGSASSACDEKIAAGLLRVSSPGPTHAASTGIAAPSLLHVAPGTHVSITIHHSSDPHAAPSAASGTDPASIIAIPTTTATAVPVPASLEQAAGGRDAGPPNSHAPLSSGYSPTPPRAWSEGESTNEASEGPLGAGCMDVRGSCSAVTAASAGWPRASSVSVASCSAVGAGAVGLGAGGGRARGGPRSIQVDSSMQHFEAVPVEEVLVDSPAGQPGSPMIVPPSEEVVAAASSLLGWQAQQGFVSADEATSALQPTARQGDSAPVCSASSATSHGQGFSNRCGLGSSGSTAAALARKVLSYDPAIGKNGAFYFVDVDSPQAPESVSGSARRPAVPPMRDQDSAGNGVRHAPGQDADHTPDSAATIRMQVAGGSAMDSAAAADASCTAGREPLADVRCGAAVRAGTATAGLVQDQALDLTAPATSFECPSAAHPPVTQDHRQPAHDCNAGAPSPGLQPTACPGPSCGAGAGRAEEHGHSRDPPQSQPHATQPPPLSPCSYAASDSTAAVTPLAPLHAAALALARAGGSGRLAASVGPQHAPAAGSGGLRAASSGVLAETPASTAGSLGRMAVMLDDLARRQHWDVQPPPGVALGQPLLPQAHPLLPEAAQHPRHEQAALAMAIGPQAVAAWLEANAGSASSVGGSCITERYDDSLVDILSQADEELEQHHLQQQRQQRLQQQQDQAVKQARQRGHRCGHVSRARAGGPRQHGLHGTAVGEAGVAAGAPAPRPQKASVDALLAANIFEENDVLSAILEQER